MSLVPLLSGLARQFDGEYLDYDRLLDDDFGFGLHPMELFQRPRSMVLHQPKHRFFPYELALAPHRHHYPLSAKGGRQGGRLRGDSTGSSSALLPTITKDGFQVCMDVSQFKPNELSVKVVDKVVTVEGKHEEREDDHGMIQRHFVRKYTLPKDYDANEVVSTISSDGVLTLKAPPPASKALTQKERIVHIQQTGPAHLSVKAPENNEKQQQQQGGADENGSAEKMETGK